MSLAKFSIKRPVTIAMITITLVFIGFLSISSMKKELMPNINVPVVTVSTFWNGATSENVEKQITKKIEDILPGIEGIDKIETISAYQISNVVVKFNYGVDINEKVTEIQREVLNIKGKLPSDISTPTVRKVDVGAGDLTASVIFSASDKNALSNFLENYLKPKIQSLEGVGKVSIFGNPTKQVQLQVNSDKLASFNLTPVELYNLVRLATPTIPIGQLENGEKNNVIRFITDINSIEEYKNLIISNGENNLKLSDVADVVLTNEDISNYSYFNGKEAISLYISKSSEADSIKLNKKIFQLIEKSESFMPSDTQRNINLDAGEHISKSISSVSKNALQGLVLASIILFLFLGNLRATSLVTVSLPIAVIFTFSFLAFNGTSLNLISLMGLSIGVGMLTDNSVVVIDNIFRHMTELNSDVMTSAEEATAEVTPSIIASALTTMVVFIPILFIPGIAREIFSDIAFSIIFSNIAALFVAITFIPMLASKFLKKDSKIKKDGKIFKKVKRYYLKIFKWAIIHKIKILLITFIILISSILIGINFIKFEFMPKQDSGKYSITAELQKGLDIEKVNEFAKKLEIPVKENTYTKSYSTTVQENIINININIGNKDDRNKSVFEIQNEIREKMAGTLDAKLTYTNKFSNGQAQKDVSFFIEGNSMQEITNLSKKILADIKKYKGVTDINSSLGKGATELRIEVDRDKLKSYSLNPVTVGKTLSYYTLGGDRTNPVTLKTDNDEIDILVRLPKNKRDSIEELKQINIKISDFNFIKLGDIAKIYLAESTDEIRKKGRLYSVKIDVNNNGVGLNEIQDKFLESFKRHNSSSSITYSWGGDSQNLTEVMSQLKLALLIAIFLIFALLASQFENFILPFIVIFSIPLSLIGVILGLIICKQAMDIMVMIGIILLAGIVVNNAIVLIDFIKLSRANGLEKRDAIIHSCETRLRPILMTTLTTVFGMIPLALGIGEGSEMYRGMAITVIFGLIFSTLLTLVLIPILYSLVDSAIEKTKRFF